MKPETCRALILFVFCVGIGLGYWLGYHSGKQNAIKNSHVVVTSTWIDGRVHRSFSIIDDVKRVAN